MRLLVGTVLGLVLAGVPSLAAAEESAPSSESSASTSGNSNAGGFEIFGQQQHSGGVESQGETNMEANPTASSEAQSTWVRGQSCETYSAVGCHSLNQCADGSPPTVWVNIDVDSGQVLGTQEQCPGDPPPAGESNPTTVTAAQVLQRFRQIPLPASTITIQPPGGKTLVNLETIYSTTATPFTRTITFFNGQITVDLTITPTSFTWHHGDNTTQTTTDPGQPWSPDADPADLITHTYTTTATNLRPRVDTTWSATWTMNGQDQGPVDGTVTRPGTPTPLDVHQAKPKLLR